MGTVEGKFLENCTHNDGMAGEGLFATLAIFFAIFAIMLVALTLLG